MKTQIHTLAYERLAYESYSRFSSQSCSSSRVLYFTSYSKILFLVHGLENEEMQAFELQFSHPIMLMCFAGVSVNRADGAVSLK